MSSLERDERFLREALELAAQGLGLTSPNPAVGAVIVRDDEILGRGWHQKAGAGHAEVEAIRDAKEKGHSDLKGTTIYVTLEPCSTTGKTPPCTRAILENGFARVVVGATDPNPEHAGRGLDLLREEGIEVTEGVLETEAKHLLRFFAKRIETGRPYVIAKSAITLDGRTTLAPGEGQWVSSEESREDVQRLRRQCDAILIGGETLRKDDPSLTLRGKYAEGRPQPLRGVFSASGDIPGRLRIFNDEFADRTRVFHKTTLLDSLKTLADEGCNAVLLESGGRLFAHALEQNLVDEVVLYVAPRLGGGANRLLPWDGTKFPIEDMKVDSVGPDLRITGRPSVPESPTE